MEVDEGAPHAQSASEAAARAQRPDVAYTALDEPFRTHPSDRAANGQYANVYFARLAKLRPVVVARMKAEWGLTDEQIGAMLSKTLDVPEETECIVLGTVYADMKAKPNVLEEYTRDPLAPIAPPPSKYCGPGDRLIIEDETGRLVLSGAVLADQRLVTGVILAVRGRLDSSSSFAVEAVCVAGFAPQRPLPPSVSLAEGEAAARESDQYIALVSGLEVGAEGDGAHSLALQLLLDYLSAHVGGSAELSLQGRIVRLVVCGGLLSEAEAGKPVVAEASKAKNARANRSLAAALHALEAMLLPVAASLPMDLMPGASDPSNVNLPQQPLHHCLLPLLARHAHFTSVTNPHAFELAGLRVVGTSGQPVTDALKYRLEGNVSETSEAPSPEQALEDMLRWRHLAPTAPDTLPCFPFAMSDPFVLAETPHLVFAGNQPRYGTRLLALADGARVRIVSVPSFAATRTAVLVNLRTLRCHPISFRGYDCAAPK